MSDHMYKESLSSNKTSLLFVCLTILFLALFTWRILSTALDTLAIVFVVFSVMFLFYSINYRTLRITINQDRLKLIFGIFSWTVPFETIQSCQPDHLPALLEFGGAGIHFFTAHQRYRVSFNFLEYPRVVITLKEKRGLVRDVSFSTQHPEDIIQNIKAAVSE